MSQPVIPERYNYYWATVAYHRTDTLREPTPEEPRPVPDNGSRVLAHVAWMMDEDDSFPGEFAFLVVYPKGYGYWMPARDLTDFELADHDESFALELARLSSPAT